MADINQHLKDKKRRDDFIGSYVEKHVHVFKLEVRLAMEAAWKSSRRYARSQSSGGADGG